MRTKPKDYSRQYLRSERLQSGLTVKALAQCEGIHHVFTEVRGGWKRTYTDAQLIGKKIEEAEHEQA